MGDGGQGWGGKGGDWGADTLCARVVAEPAELEALKTKKSQDPDVRILAGAKRLVVTISHHKRFTDSLLKQNSLALSIYRPEVANV